MYDFGTPVQDFTISKAVLRRAVAERWDHRVDLNVDQEGPTLWPMEGSGLGLRRTLRRVPAFQKNELRVCAWYLVYEYPVLLCTCFAFQGTAFFAASYSYYEPHRVSWAELREDLHRRKAFGGMLECLRRSS